MAVGLGQAPAGWPVIGDGLLMTIIDEVMFVRYEKRLSDPIHKQHLRELAAAIDRCGDDARRGVVYEVVGVGDPDAKHRADVGHMLAERREKMTRTTAAFAMVTSSMMVRGALRAIFWLAPPPYPWTVTNTLREGLGFIHTKKPELDVELVLQRYEALKQRSLSPATTR